MNIERVKTLEDLEQYQREFRNFSGDPFPYDFNSVFHLFLAILENLANHSLDADVKTLEEDRPWLTEEQWKFLGMLERIA